MKGEDIHDFYRNGDEVKAVSRHLSEETLQKLLSDGWVRCKPDGSPLAKKKSQPKGKKSRGD